MEGEEENLEAAPPTEPNAHDDEFDLTLVLIFFGLLGIAILMWFIISGTFDDRKAAPVDVILDDMGEAIDDIYTGVDDPTYVKGRDHTVLGLGMNDIVGKFFYEPETKKTIYRLSVGSVCEDECLDVWTPYLTSKERRSGQELETVYIKSLKAYQYTWNNQLLYTYNDDERFGSFLGDGYGSGILRVARP